MTNSGLVYVESKPFYRSKVLWFNGLTFIGLLLVLIMQMQSAGNLPFYIDPKWVVFFQALVNFVLRFMTNAPVTGK